LVPLNFAGLGDLEEVCVGDWGNEAAVEEEIQAVALVEMEGPQPMSAAGLVFKIFENRRTLSWPGTVKRIRLDAQNSPIPRLLSLAQPSSLHLSLQPFLLTQLSSSSFSFTMHPPPRPVAHSALVMHFFGSQLRSSRFNLDLVLKSLSKGKRKSFIADLKDGGWTEDELGWWKCGESLLND